MMTWDILKTREKVPKKISAPTIVDPISKKILSGTLFLAHHAHKLQPRARGCEGHIVHKKKPFYGSATLQALL
jgi:hypothetical protein